MPETSACPNREVLQRFFLGQVEEQEGRELQRHVAECGHCAEQLDLLAGSVGRTGGQILPGAGDPTQTPAEEDADAPHELARFVAPPQEAGEIGRLGPYRLLRVLGTGGMSVVFQAEDPHLRRRVALKVLRPALLTNPSTRPRFMREAQATAGLIHDRIIPIYQAGEDCGLPFLAMPLLQGESLEERLKREAPLPLAEVLRIGQEIAEGLEAAHRHGLVHRDIKPSNIWLEEPRDRVKLLDFGLARAVVGDVRLTGSGVVLGTPSYLAPEQARGEAVDPRSDLFSLGCVLYRMATGQLPFQGSEPMTILVALAMLDPTPPCQINAALPPALSDLILQLLAKDPAQRPPSARVVGEALEHIRLDPTVVVERLQVPPPGRSGKRGPLAVPSRRRWRRWALAVVLALGLLGTAGYLGGLTRPQPVAAPSVSPPVQPVPEVRHAEPAVVGMVPADALQDIPVPQLVAVLGNGRLQHWNRILALAYSRDGKRLASAGWDHTIKLWDGSSGQELSTLGGLTGSGPVNSLAFSPDARILATADTDPAVVTLWDVRDCKKRWILEGSGSAIRFVTFSPDGRYLAAVSGDGTLTVWYLQLVGEKSSAEPPRRIEEALKVPEGTLKWQSFDVPGHSARCPSVAFSRDSQTLACEANGSVQLFDLAKRKFLGRLAEVQGQVTAVALSRDGALLAVGDDDRRLSLWDVRWDTATAKRLRVLPGCPSVPTWLTFNQDGKWLAAACSDWLPSSQRAGSEPNTFKNCTVSLWQLVKDEPQVLQTPEGSMSPLAFNPDPGSKSLTLAYSPAPFAIHLWDPVARKDALASGAEKTVNHEGHQAEVYAGVFSPDGQWVASASADRTVRLWNAASGDECHVLREHQGAVRSVAFDPDSKLLASASEDRTVRLWDISSGEQKQVLRTDGKALAVAFSPKGHLLAWGDDQGAVRLEDLTPGSKHRPPTLPGHEGAVTCVTFSPDGKWLASASEDRTVRVWDVSTGELVDSPLRGETHYFTSVAFSPDGKMLAASGAHDPLTRLWDVSKAGKFRMLEPLRTEAETVAFSPDGKLLASSGEGCVRFWSPQSGRRLRELPLAPANSSLTVAFSPEGRYLVTANSNGTLYVLRLQGALQQGK